jgi:hypothetical protein
MPWTPKRRDRDGEVAMLTLTSFTRPALPRVQTRTEDGGNRQHRDQSAAGDVNGKPGKTE